MTKRMVFDVESVGLHGEGFAVGWVVLDENDVEESCALVFADARRSAQGVPGDREWIDANVVPTLQDADGEHVTLFENPYGVRETFWAAYQALKATGSVELWADCPWPVEANFLSACVSNKPVERNWQGPYPLLDVGVVMRCAGTDPMATHPRLPSESPAHNPLADARQSARLLIEAETRLRADEP